MSARLGLAQCTYFSIQLITKNPNCMQIHYLIVWASVSDVNIVLDMSRVPRIKNGFAPKVCIVCAKEFEWRKKWSRDWENVRYCSDRCRQSAQ